MNSLSFPFSDNDLHPLHIKQATIPSRHPPEKQKRRPRRIAFYLRELAGELHGYYNAERFLVDDEPTKLARLALLKATRQVLRNGLALLGVSAPVKM